VGKKWMTAAVAAAAAVAIAGCGGSDGSSADADALTATELRQQAQRICARAVSDIAEIPAKPGETPAESKRWGDQRMQIQTSALERLAALQPPEETRAAYDELLTSLREATELLHTTQTRMADGERIDFSDGNRLHEEVAQRTRAVKLPACQWI
jgi:hypothetical protein